MNLDIFEQIVVSSIVVFIFLKVLMKIKYCIVSVIIIKL